MLAPIFSPICLDHIPDANTTYSQSISVPLTLTPAILLFLIKIFSTGDFSNILAPSNLAALANICVTPEGSAAPSPGIKIPPITFSVFTIGNFFLTFSLSKIFTSTS